MTVLPVLRCRRSTSTSRRCDSTNLTLQTRPNRRNCRQNRSFFPTRPGPTRAGTLRLGESSCGRSNFGGDFLQKEISFVFPANRVHTSRCHSAGRMLVDNMAIGSRDHAAEAIDFLQQRGRFHYVAIPTFPPSIYSICRRHWNWTPHNSAVRDSEGTISQRAIVVCLHRHGGTDAWLSDSRAGETGSADRRDL